MCGWIVWIIIGAAAGWLASIVMGTNKKQGLIGDIVVGIIGGFVGGWVLRLAGVDAGVSGLNPISLITAFVGAVIFLGLLRVLRGRR